MEHAHAHARSLTERKRKCRCDDCHVIAKTPRNLDAIPCRPFTRRIESLFTHNTSEFYSAPTGSPLCAREFVASNHGVVRQGQLAYSGLFTKPFHHHRHCACRALPSHTGAYLLVQGGSCIDKPAYLLAARAKWRGKDGLHDIGMPYIRCCLRPSMHSITREL